MSTCSELVTHLIVVVVYKKRILETDTVRSLLNCLSIQEAAIFIWDNSPSDFESNNEYEAQSLGGIFLSAEYRATTDNTSLSLIYNSIMDYFFGNNLANCVTLLDQDSTLAPDFLLSMRNADDANHLVVPKVVSNKTGVVVSPRRQKSYYLFKPYEFRQDFQIDDAGRVPAKDLFAVGSGLTFPRKLWEEGLRFDECISFYGVDTEFCRDYQNFREEFLLANTMLIHDISSENNEELAMVGWRFEKYMDYWAYQLAKHSPFPKIFTQSYVRLFRALYKLKQAVRALL